MFGLRRAEQLFNALYAREAGSRFQVTEAQYRVLEQLHGKSHFAMTALVELTCIDRSTLSTLLETMRKRGYVTIERGVLDKRQQIVRITTPGRSAFREAKKAMERTENEFFLPLSRTDKSKFEDLLTKLVAAASQKAISPRRSRARIKLRGET